MDILVISNDITDRSVIKQVLEHGNHKVTFVKDVNEAQNNTPEGIFRFIIADAEGQEESIQQYIMGIRSNPKSAGHTYVLLLASKAQSGKFAAALDVNVDDYLNKPITPHEIKARVAVGIRILSMGDTLAQAHDQLENLAMYDHLTGFLNRQAFYKVAQGELERARRASEGISVIAMNVNDFKEINKKFGHSVGNDVLIVVSQIIREKSRPYDCIGRWDGDQFLLALPGVVSVDAEKIAKRILAGVKSNDVSLMDGTPLEVRLRAGISSTQNIKPYAEINNYIQIAVQAMNSSKQIEGEDINVVFE